MDELDRRILDLLKLDWRLSNKALAHNLGVAPSTSLTRVRALLRRGVIRGFSADVDPASLGRPLQAMISIRVHADARSRMGSFQAYVTSLPQVMNLYFLAGEVDFLVQAAVKDSKEMRDFVLESLSARAEVAMTETNIVFDHVHAKDHIIDDQAGLTERRHPPSRVRTVQAAGRPRLPPL